MLQNREMHIQNVVEKDLECLSFDWAQPSDYRDGQVEVIWMVAELQNTNKKIQSILVQRTTSERIETKIEICLPLT